jgi:hypothetical protein
MDIESFTAVAELIGAIAIIVTLVYLAIEIRQNTATVNTARYDTITAGFNEINCIIISDPELPPLFNRGMLDPSSLTDDEKARMAFIFRTYYNQFYKLYRLYSSGGLPKREWDTYAKQCAQFFGSPGGKIFLSSNPDYPEIAQAVLDYSSGPDVFSFKQ